MQTLLIILAVLFAALFVLVPLLEKFSPKGKPQDYRRLSRFIFPLLALLIVLQLIAYYFF
ncbi:MULTISPECIES: hypothetical protein [Marinobacter]|uniref:Uncharacterized protein n=1 Tax=Marinobacter profundi TaxID=2666256 RepID=A0A2G1UNC6_9GAMM|nr:MULTISPECIES: hypothetical protein [Marinobacter]MBD3655088.1 hypothetical protein [Marinobacter sp.]PHQ16001.1 hypothetical protein CLH61_07645 [Marinobacter profundi]